MRERRFKAAARRYLRLIALDRKRGPGWHRRHWRRQVAAMTWAVRHFCRLSDPSAEAMELSARMWEESAALCKLRW